MSIIFKKKRKQEKKKKPQHKAKQRKKGDIGPSFGKRHIIHCRDNGWLDCPVSFLKQKGFAGKLVHKESVVAPGAVLSSYSPEVSHIQRVRLAYLRLHSTKPYVEGNIVMY